MTDRRLPTPRALARGVGLAVAAVALLAPAAAYAHDVLVGMTPANGSLVTVAPTSVVLTFDAPVQDIGDTVLVTAPSGAGVAAGPASIVDTTVTQPLAPLTEPGHYRIAYRIVSADGHPVSAVVGFDYLVRGAAAPPPGVPTSDGGVPAVAAGVALVVAVALVVGVVLVTRRRTPTSGPG